MVMFSDQTSVWFPCDETVLDPEPKEQVEEKTKRNLRHVFISKTVQTHTHSHKQ